jgi:hypothetical protein
MDLTTKEPTMSDLVTDLHDEMINSVAPNYSINYEAEALTSYNATGDDLMEALETRATDFIAETTGADVREDLGGLTVFFRGSTLVAFYDYEQFKGHVF